MSIGYYDFGNIQRGDQQVVNSLAGLGQQIAGTIENHAQIQAAKSLLPALQGQVQSGMAKISQGDASGLADVYNASTTASQLPILSPMASHLATVATSAFNQTNENLRTKALIQGRLDAVNDRGQFAASLAAQNYNQKSGLLDQSNDARAAQEAQKNQDITARMKMSEDAKSMLAQISHPGQFGSDGVYQPAAKPQDPIKLQQELATVGNSYQKAMDASLKAGNAGGFNVSAQNVSATNQQLARINKSVADIPLNYQGAKQIEALQQQAIGPDGKTPPDQNTLNEIGLKMRQIHNDPNSLALTPDQRDTLNQAQLYFQKGIPIQAIQQKLQENGLPPTLFQPRTPIQGSQTQPDTQSIQTMGIPAAQPNPNNP